MKRWVHGWRVFFSVLVKQRRKKHGAGKTPWLMAIYGASCARYLIDHQHRRPGLLPIEGRAAQWLAHMKS